MNRLRSAPGVTQVSTDVPVLANHITFQGIDSAECERFIKEIRRVARNAGKSRDNNWIIDLATSGITGPAWRWYVQLDPDIAEDWGKLQGAMIDRWEERGPDDTVNESREWVILRAPQVLSG